MPNIIAAKTTMDGVASTLIGLGAAGLSFAVYGEKWIAGIFGALALILGVGIIFLRHIWNEKQRSTAAVPINTGVGTNDKSKPNEPARITDDNPR